MSDSEGGSGFGWFLAGLGIGAVIGLLYAPQSGAETRDAIRKRAEEGREHLRTQAREAREQAEQWVDRGKDFVQQQKEQSLSLVPMRVYFSHGLAKVELGLGRGKREHEKRQSTLKRLAEREMERAVGRHR